MKPQKAKYLKDELKKVKPNINHFYMVSEKIDGWYVYADFDKFKGWSHIHSSAGREIPSMLHCRGKYLNRLPNPKSNIRLIMEAYIPDTPFHILNGVFNRSIGKYHAEDVHFRVHDLIPLEGIQYAASIRYGKLCDYILENPTDRLIVHSVLSITKDTAEWQKLFDTITNNGGEGIVLKQADSIYYPGKRNSSLLKIKQEVTIDTLVIDMFETTGEKGNKALNLRVKRANGVEFVVVVPKHSDIAAFAEESPIGKVAEIGAMKELEGGILREPRFRWLREDKLPDEID